MRPHLVVILHPEGQRDDVSCAGFLLLADLGDGGLVRSCGTGAGERPIRALFAYLAKQNGVPEDDLGLRVARACAALGMSPAESGESADKTP